MNFERVIKMITQEFNKRKVSYALIGGYAMAFYGIIRATVDIDFIVDEKDRDYVKQTLAKNYRIFYESDNVIQFISDDIFGNIDFILAKRDIGRDILKNARFFKATGGKIKIKVARLEDIIGLKLQAIKNEPKRYIKERYDIEMIMEQQGKKLDWERVYMYFKIFEYEKDFNELRERYEG